MCKEKKICESRIFFLTNVPDELPDAGGRIRLRASILPVLFKGLTGCIYQGRPAAQAAGLCVSMGGWYSFSGPDAKHSECMGCKACSFKWRVKA